jgi:hypothetical protein
MNNKLGPSERKRCAYDFLYFARNYLIIGENDKPLILEDFQHRFIIDCELNPRLIAKKFRNGGFSTISLAYGLWKSIFHPEFNFVIIENTRRECYYMNDRLEEMMKKMPDSMRPRMNHKSLCQFELENGSKIQFAAISSYKHILGQEIDLLFVDEPAFMKNVDKLMAALAPVTEQVVAVSTPNRRDTIENPNWFHKTFIHAVIKDAIALNDPKHFSPYFADYKESSHYQDKAYLKQLKKNLGNKGWQQGVLAEFI